MERERRVILMTMVMLTMANGQFSPKMEEQLSPAVDTGHKRNNVQWTPSPEALLPVQVKLGPFTFPADGPGEPTFGRLEEEPVEMGSALVEDGSGRLATPKIDVEDMQVVTEETKDLVVANATFDDGGWVEVEVNTTRQFAQLETTVSETATTTTESTSTTTEAATTTTTPESTTTATTTTETTTTPDVTTPETVDAPSINTSGAMNTTPEDQGISSSDQTPHVPNGPTSAPTILSPRTRPHRLPPHRRLTPSPPEGASTTTSAMDVTIPHEEEEEVEEEEDPGTQVPHVDVGTIPASATNAIIISSVIGGCAVIFFAVLMGFCMWRQRTRTPRRPIYRPPDLGTAGGLTAIGGPLPALQLQNPKCSL